MKLIPASQPQFTASGAGSSFATPSMPHLLLSAFLLLMISIPGAAGLWPAPLSGLAGIPVDGGFSTVDVGNPVAGVRANSVDGFMFDHGAAHRLISEAGPTGMRSTISIPEGTSGVLGSPDY